jgi:hypothetical protein
MKTPTKQKSNATIARENELEALKFIALFGWLNAQQIGNLGWHRSTEHVARNKASACLNRLEANGFVKVRIGYSGIRNYVLTRSGADFTNHACNETIAHHGLELSVNMHLKQEYIVRYLTNKFREECTPFGRAALRLNIGNILTHFQYGEKMLDGAYYNNNTGEVRGVICPATADANAVVKFEKLLRPGNVDLIGSDWIVESIQRQIRRM